MSDSQSLNDEGRGMWDNKAAFWDNLHGDDGNKFHRQLVSPAAEKLLALDPGERVLDVACGNGAMARRMADLGAVVTACDFSAALIALAQQRSAASGATIIYHVADATDEAALVALGDAGFDAITCTMALMDMPEIAPLYRAVRQLLKPGGRFVFVTAHPAFNSNNPVFIAEMEDRDGELLTRHGLKIFHYMTMPPVKAVGAVGEPNAHYYYHRPLHELLGAAFDAGLVLDGLEEIAFPPDDSADKRLSWVSMEQIPPVMAGRLRVAGA